MLTVFNYFLFFFEYVGVATICLYSASSLLNSRFCSFPGLLCFISALFSSSFSDYARYFRGYWRQRADERLGDPPQRWIQEPSVVRDRDGRPQEDALAMHCFCVCSGSALLGDLVVSRSVERDLLSVLLIYLRIFFGVFIAYRL